MSDTPRDVAIIIGELQRELARVTEERDAAFNAGLEAAENVCAYHYGVTRDADDLNGRFTALYRHFDFGRPHDH